MLNESLRLTVQHQIWWLGVHQNFHSIGSWLIDSLFLAVGIFTVLLLCISKLIQINGICIDQHLIDALYVLFELKSFLRCQIELSLAMAGSKWLSRQRLLQVVILGIPPEILLVELEGSLQMASQLLIKEVLLLKSHASFFGVWQAFEITILLLRSLLCHWLWWRLYPNQIHILQPSGCSTADFLDW